MVLFAKNSDREPNEGHHLLHIPRSIHAHGSKVRCTYIEVPQVRETYQVLLSKPFWIWGCEMGINEHGVTIGNEAVFTKEPMQKRGGLLGMDLMRLALERSATAREALDLTVQLLETYGQGGNAGFSQKLYYHNSFILADPGEAWVLETAGRYWAALRVQDVYGISNGLTIGTEWDMASPGLVENAVKRGWCRSEDDFHFARCYSDRFYTYFSRCAIRQQRTTDQLVEQRGYLTEASMMALLRDHGPEAGPSWSPSDGSMRQVCMHAGPGPTRDSQSTSSMVVHLDPHLITCWFTGTSAPCTGVFKPVYPEAGLPDLGPPPTGTFDPESLWWRHERLHRAVLEDYATRLDLYRRERDLLESSWIEEAARLAEQYRMAPVSDRRTVLRSFAEGAFVQADEATRLWTDQVLAAPKSGAWTPLFGFAWSLHNRRAGM
jgi:dipeptidase